VHRSQLTLLAPLLPSLPEHHPLLSLAALVAALVALPTAAVSARSEVLRVIPDGGAVEAATGPGAAALTPARPTILRGRQGGEPPRRSRSGEALHPGGMRTHDAGRTSLGAERGGLSHVE
jgi:hypothetical protein